MKDIKTLKQMYYQMMYILNQEQKHKMIVMFLLVLLGAVLETLGVSVILPFAQMLIDSNELLKKPYIIWFMHTFSISDIGVVTILVGIGVILIFIIKNLGLMLSSLSLVKFKAELGRELKRQMMECYMKRPYFFFVNSNTGDIIRGVSGDIDSLRGVVDGIFHTLKEGLVILLIGIYIFFVDPIMAAGSIFIGILCMGGIILVLKKKMSRLGIICREAEGRAYALTTQIIYGIKDIMVRQKRDVFLEKYDEANRENCKGRIGSEFVNLLPERFIEVICISGIISIVLVRIAFGGDNKEFVSVLAIFAVAAFRVLPAISRIAGAINLLVFSRTRLEGVYENIKAARDYMEKVGNDDKNYDLENENRITFERNIKISNICWQYNAANGDVLHDLSIEIKKGEAIGIIGESGSGKSTLSDILLGLYIPQKGSVTVDGHSIFDIPYTWSKIMGYVPQSVYLLDDTIRNNVAFGEKVIKDDEVWAALEKASLKKYVEKLPDGLDTMVGERGIKFSGGQRQRIAIARALFSNPSILILDEATSALDNETESAVMEAIESLQGTITMIIIAHRLTTIRNCDRVLEISDGRAIEVHID